MNLIKKITKLLFECFIIAALITAGIIAYKYITKDKSKTSLQVNLGAASYHNCLEVFDTKYKLNAKKY